MAVQPGTDARTMATMAVVSIFVGGSTKLVAVEPVALDPGATDGTPEVTG